MSVGPLRLAMGMLEKPELAEAMDSWWEGKMYNWGGGCSPERLRRIIPWLEARVVGGGMVLQNF